MVARNKLIKQTPPHDSLTTALSGGFTFKVAARYSTTLSIGDLCRLQHHRLQLKLIAIDTTRKMKRVHRLGQIEKIKLFTQKQAVELSGFTRSQLLTWEEAGIVIPDREYAILYTWNQIILLRILYHIRQRWTFQQTITGFENSRQSIETILQMLPKSVLVTFGEFGVYPDVHLDFIAQALSKVKDEVEEKSYRNIFADEDYPFIRNGGRQTQIAVPQIIKEVKALAKEKEIQNLDLKFG